MPRRETSSLGGAAIAWMSFAFCTACTQRAEESPFATGGSDDGSTTGVSSGSGSPTGADAPDGSEGSSGSDDGHDSGVKLDVAAHDPDAPPGEGCQKVDFLFVIDASPSMEAEQTQLVASFPGFIDSIASTLDAQDYHIMVTDVDAHPQYTPVGGNGFCEDGSCCGNLCSNDPQANWCNNEPCVDHSGDCDFTLGAGKNDDEDWQDCGLPGGKRWMEGSDPNLLQHFECVAKVGTYGYFDETQGAAVSAALSSEQAAPTGCNEGFLREDAVLVVTLISDEEDITSPGDPPEWFEAIVQAKGGDPQAVVFLGLVGDFGQPGSPCAPYDPTGTGAQNAVRLRALVDLFGSRGLLGSVCASDYVPFFEEAVGLIDTACDEFEPPG